MPCKALCCPKHGNETRVSQMSNAKKSIFLSSTKHAQEGVQQKSETSFTIDFHGLTKSMIENCRSTTTSHRNTHIQQTCYWQDFTLQLINLQINQWHSRYLTKIHYQIIQYQIKKFHRNTKIHFSDLKQSIQKIVNITEKAILVKLTLKEKIMMVIDKIIGKDFYYNSTVAEFHICSSKAEHK